MKKKPTTPPEYSTVCPYLMVNDIAMQISFMKEVFNATVKEEVKDDKGELMRGEVVLGEVVIMMGKARPQWPAQPSMNYVFVDDVEMIFEAALKAGAGKLMEPGDRDYQLREGGFSDPQGNQWWIAQPLNKRNAGLNAV